MSITIVRDRDYDEYVTREAENACLAYEQIAILIFNNKAMTGKYKLTAAELLQAIEDIMQKYYAA